MQIYLDRQTADCYTSGSQKARKITEGWVQCQGYCPNCGEVRLEQFEANRKVADFYCARCQEQYELKSQRRDFVKKAMDGEYATKIERLNCSTNPNLLLLNYNADNLAVNNFLVVPKHFFTSEIIEKRKPLSPTAQRAGWVGSNILLQGIPQSGRIYLIKDGVITPRQDVLATWRRTMFLRDETDLKSRGWLLDVMAAVEKLDSEFTLRQVYEFEDALGRKHPENRHVKDKIRQQLQVLRDRGYLEFIGRGQYRLA